MTYIKPGLSREFKAVEDWSAAARDARFELERFASDRAVLNDCFDQVTTLVSRFGEAELVARHRERLDALDLGGDLHGVLGKRYDAMTKEGVAAVDLLRGTLNNLRGELADLDVSKIELKPLRTELLKGFKSRLAEVEIKGSDAKKLNAAFASAVEAMASGPDALIDMADMAAAELAALRQGADRGAQDNIAPWKLINLVAIFAVFLIGALITAFARGNAKAIAWITTMVLVIAGFACLMIFC